jgi:hypothetical protein
VGEAKNQVSESERLIAPEILDDAFYDRLKALSMLEPVKHVLEIGSSSGEGSTVAFYRGMRLNLSHPKLYCLEVSRTRFAELKHRYASADFIKCYNMSAVASSRVATEQEIELFYNAHATALNQYDLPTIFGWRTEGLQYLKEFPELDRAGIAEIKKSEGIGQFDIVLIDGSEFTGSAELEDVYGAKIICLDDVNAFKCYDARQRLLADPEYELLDENLALRNGYSIFCRRDYGGNWPAAQRIAAASIIPPPSFHVRVYRKLKRIYRRLFRST